MHALSKTELLNIRTRLKTQTPPHSTNSKTDNMALRYSIRSIEYRVSMHGPCTQYSSIRTSLYFDPAHVRVHGTHDYWKMATVRLVEELEDVNVYVFLHHKRRRENRCSIMHT